MVGSNPIANVILEIAEIIWGCYIVVSGNVYMIMQCELVYHYACVFI